MDIEDDDDEFGAKAVEGKDIKTKTKLVTGKLLHEFFYDEHDPCWTVAEAIACVESQEGPSARTVDNTEVRESTGEIFQRWKHAAEAELTGNFDRMGHIQSVRQKKLHKWAASTECSP